MATITIAHRTFKTKKDLKAFVKAIRLAYAPTRRLNADDEEFMRAFFHTLHPYRAEFAGFDEVWIARNDYGDNHFVLRNTQTGKYLPVSYLKCLSPSHKATQVAQAFRVAVSSQILDFKNKVFNGEDTIICPLIGQIVGYNDVDVHHCGVPFATIMECFLGEYHLDIEQISLLPLGNGGHTLPDDLAALWGDYHYQHATLECISVAAHKGVHYENTH